MKKKLILLLIPVLILSLLCGCNKGGEPASPLNVIYEANHQRDEISSRIFRVFKMETENAFYEIENKEDIDAVSAESIINDIEKIVKKIITYKNELFVTKPTIIITLYDIKTGIEFEEAYCINNTVVANFDMIGSYDLTFCIVEAMSNIHDYWLLNGIAGSVMNITTDPDQLRAYYSDSDNLHTLDFFGMRFMNEFNGEDVAYAKQTAIALYKYIDDKYGFDSIVSLEPQIQIKVTKGMKNEWLKSIGVKNIYDSKYDGLFDGYRFTKKDDYDITIISSFAEYNIMMQEDEEFLLTSIDNLELFLYKNKMGFEELVNILKKSKFYSQIMHKDKIVFEINESVKKGGAASNFTGTVYLFSSALEYAHIHEIVHTYFVPYPTQENRNQSPCLMEGLPCYLSNQVTASYTYITDPVSKKLYTPYYNIVYTMNKNNYNGQAFKSTFENSVEFEQHFLDYYIKHGGKNGPLEQFDNSIFIDSISYATIKTDNLFVNKSLMYVIYESYVTYLVNTYSLDHVIEANMDSDSFEEIFGKTFEVSFEEWKSYILSY
ncbi:MAG: hypothetical protein WC554_19460 [Clostridia bacterium]